MLVFGIEFPILEFLLFLNIIMLIYIIISMIELREILKLKKSLFYEIDEMKKSKGKKKHSGLLFRRPLFSRPPQQQ